MIEFRDTQGRPIDLSQESIAIGCFDTSGDLIAICRDATNREIADSEEFTEETGISYGKQDPCEWSHWELVVNIDSDDQKVAIQRMIASMFNLSCAIWGLTR